jgi:hypothetical protein
LEGLQDESKESRADDLYENRRAEEEQQGSSQEKDPEGNRYTPK